MTVTASKSLIRIRVSKRFGEYGDALCFKDSRFEGANLQLKIHGFGNGPVSWANSIGKIVLILQSQIEAIYKSTYQNKMERIVV